MASNSFGQIFKITTWGESHGKAIGVVIDGCPANLALSAEDINQELAWRAPGKNAYTTQRQENDIAEIYSGIFEGKTTGAPISIIIQNQDVDSSKYHAVKNLLKPGHAHFTYLNKYGIYDYLGGGRASARETATRVAAGAVAKKILLHFDIQVTAYLSQVADIKAFIANDDIKTLQQATNQSPVYCPDPKASAAMMQSILTAKAQGDSVGGIVHFITSHLPIGLGDPVYEKLTANLAKAMFSIPACKAFEMGTGFQASQLLGSQHNDLFMTSDNSIQTLSNHAGGTLGGISTGMPVWGSIAFKAPSSIEKPQATVDIDGKTAILQLPEGSRHDPCVAIRAVPVVSAMLALVLVDALLLNRGSKL